MAIYDVDLSGFKLISILPNTKGILTGTIVALCEVLTVRVMVFFGMTRIFLVLSVISLVARELRIRAAFDSVAV